MSRLRQRLGLWLVYLLALLGAALGLNPGAPTSPALSGAEPTAWDMPAMPAAGGVDAAYRNLSQRKPWGEASATGAAVVTAQAGAPWTLQGIIRQGGVPRALIRQDGILRRYAVGDRLPDGERLLDIRANGIRVTRGQTQRDLRLHE